MMDDLTVLMRKISRIIFFFLFLGCLGWAIWPEWEVYFGGFLIGTVGSILFTWQLAWKVIRIAEMAVGGRRGRGFGFLSRASLALLAAVISVRTLGYDPAATVAGLIMAPMATLVLGLSSIRRKRGGHRSDERGEKQ
ncbi:ATP synthase subunit I [Cohnella boryungensis]|uniref:ATP synthase subunit I n=1 Tax=Cohnella boryungensis TaxID=768479 RepID=A0ABV8S8R0_9BACL